jgi:hypothetical protein
MRLTAEGQRLEESRERKAHWKRWGPYLSERQWGVVREDYSAAQQAWWSFPHEHSHLRAYRWGEDGLAGISDRRQYICFALALWNGRDPILKERLFGLTGHQGNHGEDVKELYYYLDSTPTHSYMKYLYKYPQAAFPYRQLVEENARRGKLDPEFELADTGVFDNDRYFDVFVEYAKKSPEEIAIRITAYNRGPQAAELHLLPTIWFRNTWSWNNSARPELREGRLRADARTIELEHSYYGTRQLVCGGGPTLLFTENDTNRRALYGQPNDVPYTKNAFHDYLVSRSRTAVNPKLRGTKAAALYRHTIPSGGSFQAELLLTDRLDDPPLGHDALFELRRQEADAFFERRAAQQRLSEDARRIQRQAYAGLLWSKQFYHFDVATWLEGDPVGPPAPPSRQNGRNSEWRHLYNEDIISMPDKWEYPWYAAWDLAFHCVPLANVDPDFAKEQLILLLREWYMHPNGQIPAYEWNFSDVNPPVHAWAAWRVYKIEERIRGEGDRGFLERVFHKLLLNFTWWVNRKDLDGNNLFQGGFLGLDNIGLFDRSNIPPGLRLAQSDSTSWMAMFCLNMLSIALELAQQNRSYSDVASKFFEHFVYITHAMHGFGRDSVELWDDRDGFYYDVLYREDGHAEKLRVRSMVGLIPLFAVQTLEPGVIDSLPGFKRRMQWFIDNRPWFRQHLTESQTADGRTRRLLSVVNPARLARILEPMLDEEEFLAPHGIRSMSRFHKDNPYSVDLDGRTYRIEYEPAESKTYMFGGNSNWRGPVWFPLNYLLIESLQRFHRYLGDGWTVDFPTGSGKPLHLTAVAAEISRRLSKPFFKEESGHRAIFGAPGSYHSGRHFRDHLLFHEFFDGDTGQGLGASHQTGWTGLIAKLLEQSGEGDAAKS